MAVSPLEEVYIGAAPRSRGIVEPTAAARMAAEPIALFPPVPHYNPQAANDAK